MLSWEKYLRRRQGRPTPQVQILSFLAVFGKKKSVENNRLAHPLWELAPLSGKSLICHCWRWRIQDFSDEEGVPTLKEMTPSYYFGQFFFENFVKMRKIREGARPLDLPIVHYKRFGEWGKRWLIFDTVFLSFCWPTREDPSAKVFQYYQYSNIYLK